MRENYSIDQFTVNHQRVIPTTFKERIKFFWESSLNDEEITDRIYLTSRYETDGLDRERRPARTGMYFQCLNEVRKEIKRLEDAEKRPNTGD